MRKIILILSMLWGIAQAQTIGYFRYDTAKFYTTKVGGRGSIIVTGAGQFTGLLPKSAGTDSIVVRDVNGFFGVAVKPGGSIPGIDDVLAVNQALSTNRTLATAGNNLLITGLSSFAFQDKILGQQFSTGKIGYLNFANSMAMTSGTLRAITLYEEDGTMAGNRIIAGGGFDLTWNNSANITLNATSNILLNTASSPGFNSFLQSTTSSSHMQSNRGAGATSQFSVYTDSIKLLPHLGKFIIDTLNYSANTDDSMLVWRKSTGYVGMRAIPTGGSSTITKGTTVTSGFAAGGFLRNNAGVVDEYTTTGSGTVAPLQTQPTLLKAIMQGDGYDIAGIRSLSGGGNIVGWEFQTTGGVNIGGAYVLANVGSMHIDPYSAVNTLVLENTTGAIGMGTASPAASSRLDITSTTKGFLPPRMTTTQKNAISSPAEGLVVYDLTLHKLCVYTGSVWETVTSL